MRPCSLLNQKKGNRRVISVLVAAIFMVNTFASSVVYAGSLSVLNLPAPGAMLLTGPDFTPVLLKGVTIYPDDPLKFNFLIERGDARADRATLKKEAQKMIKYFLATITTPENDLWVNLSPYEKNRIVPESFGQTQMGRDLLAQDYLLKQLTASLIYPEDNLGKKFWGMVYDKVQKAYGRTDVPINTFNKVWILPQKAKVYVHGANAFVVNSHLKVMLEEDYLAIDKTKDNGPETKGPKTNALGSQIVRETILPEIEKEVNTGKNFAGVRQAYNAMILATWYKKNLKESLLGKVYMNQGKTKGVDVEDKEIKQKIYNQYLQAFKKGVFNYIKEDFDPATRQTVPRKYFSGGAVGPTAAGLLEERVFDNLSAAEQAYLPQSDRAMSVRANLYEITPGNTQAMANAAQAIEKEPSRDHASLAYNELMGQLQRLLSQARYEDMDTQAKSVVSTYAGQPEEGTLKNIAKESITLRDITDRISRFKEEIEGIKTSYEYGQARFLVTEMAQKLEQQRGRLMKKEQQIGDMLTQLKENQEQLIAKNAQLAENARQLNEKKAQLEQNRQEIAENGKQQLVLRQELNQAQEMLGLSRERLAKVAQAEAVVLGRIERFQGQLAAVDEKKNPATAKDLSNRIERLQRDLPSKASDKKQAEFGVNAADREVQEKEAPLEGLNGSAEAMEQAKQAIEASIAGIEAQVKAEQGAIAVLEANIRTAPADITVAQEAKSRLENDVIATEQSLREATEDQARSEKGIILRESKIKGFTQLQEQVKARVLPLLEVKPVEVNFTVDNLADILSKAPDGLSGFTIVPYLARHMQASHPGVSESHIMARLAHLGFGNPGALQDFYDRARFTREMVLASALMGNDVPGMLIAGTRLSRPWVEVRMEELGVSTTALETARKLKDLKVGQVREVIRSVKGEDDLLMESTIMKLLVDLGFPDVRASIDRIRHRLVELGFDGLDKFIAERRAHEEEQSLAELKTEENIISFISLLAQEDQQQGRAQTEKTVLGAFVGIANEMFSYPLSSEKILARLRQLFGLDEERVGIKLMDLYAQHIPKASEQMAQEFYAALQKAFSKALELTPSLNAVLVDGKFPAQEGIFAVLDGDKTFVSDLDLSKDDLKKRLAQEQSETLMPDLVAYLIKSSPEALHSLIGIYPVYEDLPLLEAVNHWSVENKMTTFSRKELAGMVEQETEFNMNIHFPLSQIEQRIKSTDPNRQYKLYRSLVLVKMIFMDQKVYNAFIAAYPEYNYVQRPVVAQGTKFNWDEETVNRVDVVWYAAQLLRLDLNPLEQDYTPGDLYSYVMGLGDSKRIKFVPIYNQLVRTPGHANPDERARKAKEWIGKVMTRPIDKTSPSYIEFETMVREAWVSLRSDSAMLSDLTKQLQELFDQNRYEDMHTQVKSALPGYAGQPEEVTLQSISKESITLRDIADRISRFEEEIEGIKSSAEYR
ncbi:MAG: hypothetical protein HY591_03575, partial [Candidatus Omnitrophica bacterium]|nr:hypothetical protein [Candidatus Omnitrophota bacterium]